MAGTLLEISISKNSALRTTFTVAPPAMHNICLDAQKERPGWTLLSKTLRFRGGPYTEGGQKWAVGCAQEDGALFKGNCTKGEVVI